MLYVKAYTRSHLGRGWVFLVASVRRMYIGELESIRMYDSCDSSDLYFHIPVVQCFHDFIWPSVVVSKFPLFLSLL